MRILFAFLGLLLILGPNISFAGDDFVKTVSLHAVYKVQKSAILISFPEGVKNNVEPDGSQFRLVVRGAVRKDLDYQCKLDPNGKVKILEIGQAHFFVEIISVGPISPDFNFSVKPCEMLWHGNKKAKILKRQLRDYFDLGVISLSSEEN